MHYSTQKWYGAYIAALAIPIPCVIVWPVELPQRERHTNLARDSLCGGELEKEMQAPLADCT